MLAVADAGDSSSDYLAGPAAVQLDQDCPPELVPLMPARAVRQIQSLLYCLPPEAVP